jgi:hypothetical protein
MLECGGGVVIRVWGKNFDGDVCGLFRSITAASLEGNLSLGSSQRGRDSNWVPPALAPLPRNPAGSTVREVIDCVL